MKNTQISTSLKPVTLAVASFEVRMRDSYCTRCACAYLLRDGSNVWEYTKAWEYNRRSGYLAQFEIQRWATIEGLKNLTAPSQVGMILAEEAPSRLRSWSMFNKWIQLNHKVAFWSELVNLSNYHKIQDVGMLQDQHKADLDRCWNFAWQAARMA